MTAFAEYVRVSQELKKKPRRWISKSLNKPSLRRLITLAECERLFSRTKKPPGWLKNSTREVSEDEVEKAQLAWRAKAEEALSRDPEVLVSDMPVETLEAYQKFLLL